MISFGFFHIRKTANETQSKFDVFISSVNTEKKFSVKFWSKFDFIYFSSEWPFKQDDKSDVQVKTGFNSWRLKSAIRFCLIFNFLLLCQLFHFLSIIFKQVEEDPKRSDFFSKKLKKWLQVKKTFVLLLSVWFRA